MNVLINATMKRRTPPVEILRRFLLAVALSCLSSGCATWSEHGVTLDSRKARIAVLPVENAVPVNKLGDIQTLPANEPASTNEQAMIQRAMGTVTDQVGARIEAGLDRSYFFQPVPRDEVCSAARTLGIALDAAPLSGEQLKQLGRAVDADGVLVVTLSGYGKIKKKWFYWLVGSGLVEGVVQGVAAAVVVDNPWVGVGVATEEILQEGLTWGGGTYLFNRVLTPVIVEASLVSTSDGSTIWSHTAFARVHRKALKTLPKSERGKKEVRLKLTAQRAVDDVLENMDRKAFKNITYRGLEADATGSPGASNAMVHVTADRSTESHPTR